MEFTMRQRLQQALAGEPVNQPVYVAYDWFVENRDINWPDLFARGMGRINHAGLLDTHWPHVKIETTVSRCDDMEWCDVRWITDRGELHEWYLGEWRQEYLIKTPQDYRIMARALSDATFTLNDSYFEQSEKQLAGLGITLGQLGSLKENLESRSPLQRIQVDFAGLEQFSFALAEELPELLKLIELMDNQTLEKARAIRSSQATWIKLWENLSIEMLGPNVYRRYLVPLYEQILDIFAETGKKLIVHYDGQLKVIADDIARLPFSGLDSLTPPPEGDLTISEARQLWPDKFFWLHPSLSWFDSPLERLAARIEQMVQESGPRNFCLQLSEEIPSNWQYTIPTVLDTLQKI